MIGIVDYGAGNIRSLGNALERLDKQFFVSRNVQELQRADKLMLPGVGEARSAIESLNRGGLLGWLPTIRVPFLGICIGMQILFEHSDERDTACLGIVPGRVARFDDTVMKVPHMGWNRVHLKTQSPLFQGIPDGEFFYFVHSYAAPLVPDTIGSTEYGREFSAAVQHNNFYGVQFHAEKSGNAGLQLLRNFSELC
ncbi:MAG: imidazole glycerol phosphate synthase subunit HisH [Ignavibacteriales bacterium]|nr:imidazole glycerol phosphate synthase subunit HisH [Ignavibacteriales bacterium]